MLEKIKQCRSEIRTALGTSLQQEEVELLKMMETAVEIFGVKLCIHLQDWERLEEELYVGDDAQIGATVRN